MQVIESTAEYLTPPQAAKLLGIGHDKVLGFIHAGELAAVNLATRTTGHRPRWRISRDALEQFLQGRSAVAPPKQSRRRRQQPAAVKDYF